MCPAYIWIPQAIYINIFSFLHVLEAAEPNKYSARPHSGMNMNLSRNLMSMNSLSQVLHSWVCSSINSLALRNPNLLPSMRHDSTIARIVKILTAVLPLTLFRKGREKKKFVEVVLESFATTDDYM